MDTNSYDNEATNLSTGGYKGNRFRVSFTEKHSAHTKGLMCEKGPVMSMNETQGPQSQDAGAIATLVQKASRPYFQQDSKERGAGRPSVQRHRVISLFFNSDKPWPQQNQTSSF